MKWSLGLVAGLSLVSTAVGVGCADPPRIPTEQRSTVSSTLATYDATAETKSKFGITKWRLRHVADGSVLEGLDSKGKRISHISLAVRKGAAGKQAAMFWFSGKDKRRGFVMSTPSGAAVHTLPATLPRWSAAARRDLARFAATGKTPYGCADDIFGLLGTFLQAAPECAKTDSLRSCISKLSSGGGNKLGGAAKALQSCMKAATSSGSNTGGGASNSPGSSNTGSSANRNSGSNQSGSNAENGDENGNANTDQGENANANTDQGENANANTDQGENANANADQGENANANASEEGEVNMPPGPEVNADASGVDTTDPVIQNDFGSEPPIQNDFGSEPPIENDFGNDPPLESGSGDGF